MTSEDVGVSLEQQIEDLRTENNDLKSRIVELESMVGVPINAQSETAIREVLGFTFTQGNAMADYVIEELKKRLQ